MREDLMCSILCTLASALSPELLEFFQQGPSGTEEEGILLGDGVIQRRVIAVAMQPATENTVISIGAVPIENMQQQQHQPKVRGMLISHKHISAVAILARWHQVVGLYGARLDQCLPALSPIIV